MIKRIIGKIKWFFISHYYVIKDHRFFCLFRGHYYVMQMKDGEYCFYTCAWCKKNIDM